MDSMRHLSTSLPGSRQRTDDSTPDILGDFKAAALSVTNLYKTAAKSQERARAAGYQDALDDLLSMLDKENLGLMDGEGWRVRQWATERLDGERTSAPKQATDTSSNMADDEDDGSTAKDDDERSSSPEVQRKPQHHPLANSSSDLAEDETTSQHRRVVSEPPQQHTCAPLQGDFTFHSSHAYPSNHERDMELDNSSTTPQHQSTTGTSNPSSTETVRIIPRSSGRSNNRHNKRNNNTAEGRLPTLNFNLGTGAGSKRKLPYPDFFDISGINESGDRKDGNGGSNGNGRGGKRGRHV